MGESGRARFGALTLELFVVVLGVLVALAADSFWEERTQRSREQAYLDAVVRDMAAARDTITAAMQGTVAMSAAFLPFQSWMGGAELPDDFEVPKPQLLLRLQNLHLKRSHRRRNPLRNLMS